MDRRQFIEQFGPIAEQVGRETGIHPETIMAVAAHETGWGRSVRGNNFFGIKGEGQTFQTHEVVNGQRVNMRDSFRAYEGFEEAARDFANLINTSDRYAAARNAQTPADQLRALRAGGYATDPNWARATSSIAGDLNRGALNAANRMAGGSPSTALAFNEPSSGTTQAAPRPPSSANLRAGQSLASGAQSTLAKLATRNSPPALGPQVDPITSGSKGGSLNTTDTTLRPSLADKVAGTALASNAQTQISRMATDPTLGLKTGIRSTAGFNAAFANTGLRQAIAAALPSTGMPVDRVATPRLADVGSQFPVPGGPPMRPENMGTGGPGVAALPGSPEMARMAALYAPYGGAQASVTQAAPAGSTLNAPGRNQLSGGNYQVQSGDTASTIASRNNITLNQLLQLNPGISNPNQIYAGESLNVPQAANVNAAPQRNSLNTTNTSMGSSNTIRANVAGTRTNVTKTAPGVYYAGNTRVYRQH